MTVRRIRLAEPVAHTVTQAIQIITSASRRDEADKIARVLVERRLAACVQVLGPMSSTYHWQGKIETAEEWLCIAKTAERNFVAVEEAIRELHSYAVPEILAVPVIQGSQPYLEWLEQEAGGSR